MKWFSERFVRPSEKNGSIKVVRRWGRWSVSVADCGQTTVYTNTMWEQAFKRLVLHAPHVLLLGLGAAGSVPLLHKRFPGCDITAVEYDPEMITLARDIGLYRPFPFPNTIEGDAAAVVPTLADRYNLIIIDLFNGPEPSTLVSDTLFMQTIKARMAEKGVLLINVYKRAEYLEAVKEQFPHATLWRFADNHLGAFRAAL